MLHEIIIAGFGGQGIMSMGQLLAYSGMIENKEVSWLPSYGPEQRGGTANVSVIISDEPIGSPLISHPTAAVVLNNPSFTMFEPLVQPGGILITNSSLIDLKSARTDIQVIEIPASDWATQMGEPRVANSIILGTYLALTKVVSPDSVLESLKKVLSGKNENLITLNKAALEKGAEFVTQGV